VPQRQPPDGVGLDAGHRVGCGSRPVRGIQHHGGSCWIGHFAAWHLGTEGGCHADRCQRAAAGPSGRPELTDRRSLQKELVVETSTIHQTWSSGKLYNFISYNLTVLFIIK